MTHCSSWPEFPNFSCFEGGDRTILGNNISILNFETCEALCIEEKENGCCGLDNENCFWYKDAITRINPSGISVACSKG